MFLNILGQFSLFPLSSLTVTSFDSTWVYTAPVVFHRTRGPDRQSMATRNFYPRQTTQQWSNKWNKDRKRTVCHGIQRFCDRVEATFAPPLGACKSTPFGLAPSKFCRPTSPETSAPPRGTTVIKNGGFILCWRDSWLAEEVQRTHLEVSGTTQWKDWAVPSWAQSGRVELMKQDQFPSLLVLRILSRQSVATWWWGVFLVHQ